MKHTRTIDTPVTEITEIFCNKCGLSCRSPEGDFYGLIEQEVVGGFSSTHLKDGDVHKFSLCERCLIDLKKEFIYDSFQGNYLDPDPENQVSDFDAMKYRDGIIFADDPKFQELSEVLQGEEILGEFYDALADAPLLTEEELELEEIFNLPVPRRVKKEDMN